MNNFIQILGLLINPWTVLLIVFFLLFRNNVIDLLSTIANYMASAKGIIIKYKDIEISAEKAEEIKKKFLTVSNSDFKKAILPSISSEYIQRHKQLISNSLTRDELKTFLSFFQDEEYLVIDSGSNINDKILALERIGLVKKGSEYIFTTNKRKKHIVWEMTPVGKVIRTLFLQGA